MNVTSSPVETTPMRTPASEGLIDVRLTAIRYAARDTNLYDTRADGKPLPGYEPGSHVDLHLPNGLVRQYSLINPGQTESYARHQARSGEPGGSRYVHDELRVGKTLKISAAQQLRAGEDAAHVVLLAGGIGITPIWCMVQRLAELGRPGSSTTPPLARRHRVSRIARAAGREFHFDDEREGKFLDVADRGGGPEGRASLLLRADPMLSAFEAATANWPREQVHVEYFTPKQEPDKKGGFVVELARSGQEFVIPEGKSILEVLLDAGVDVDYSCELGICGACEQRVISANPSTATPS